MPTSIDLRPAGPADADAIAAIYRPAVLTGLASFEEEPPDADEMARRMAAIVEAGFPYLVAEIDGRVVGYAYASAYRTRPGYRFTCEDSVYVADHAQGRGVGRVLLGRLIDDCTAMGKRRMIAVIGDLGNAGSIALHRALGFEVAGVLPAIGWKLGRFVDSVLMQRPLGDGDRTAPTERP